MWGWDLNGSQRALVCKKSCGILMISYLLCTNRQAKVGIGCHLLQYVVHVCGYHTTDHADATERVGLCALESSSCYAVMISMSAEYIHTITQDH